MGEMNGLRVRTVSTSLGEWVSSGHEWSQSPCHPVSGSTCPGLAIGAWCGKGTAPGCAWCLRGAMLLRGFRLFGVALHREPKGTKRPAETPHHHNTQTPWANDCEEVHAFCGQHASLKLSTHEVRPLYESLCKRPQIAASNPELTINEILASHADPKYRDWQTVIVESSVWQINPTDTGDLAAQCTGLGGSELDEEWDVLLACKKDAHVYGPSLSKQDDWDAKRRTIAGTAHTQEYFMLHLALFPVGLLAWCGVHGVQERHQVQAQIIHRAQRVLEFGPVTPAHRKPPWTLGRI